MTSKAEIAVTPCEFKKLQISVSKLINSDTSSVDLAFIRLIGAFSVMGNYPEKQKAMSVAVETLGEDASEDDLYNEAVNQLG